MSPSRFNYSYSPLNGRISSITNLESGLVTTYAHDLMDRVTNILYRTSNETLIRSLNYAYDASSMITEKADFNALTASTNLTSYQYDSLNRLISESTSSDENSLLNIEYSYDLAGNRLSKIRDDGNSINYTPGIGNRLDSWSVASTAGFDPLCSRPVAGTSSEPVGTDDRWGQLWVSNSATQVSVTPQIEGSCFVTDPIFFNAGTQQISVAIRDQAGNVGYDTQNVMLTVVTNAQIGANAAGCITNIAYTGTGGFSESVSLNWDERYRLTSAVRDSLFDIRYSYDVLGRRISVFDGIDTIHMIYDGQQVVADTDESGNLLRTYTWGPGIDNLLSIAVYGSEGQMSNVYYAVTDLQNTVLALVDSSGTVVESYEYDAWENVLSVKDGNGVPQASSLGTPTSQIGNRYLFQGREYDSATGLYYFRARWYNPKTGRWLSKDPIGISGGLNLYVFCGNNPVNRIDPYGLRWLGGGDDPEGWTVGREDTFIEPGEGNRGGWLEQYFPAMETMSEYHDPVVGFLTDLGVPDWLANIPTMGPSYQAALITEILKTPGYIGDAIKDLFDKDTDSPCK